jgi:hypothetical protein
MTDENARLRDERALKRFFDERLIPAADRLKADGVELLDTKLDPAAQSYYRKRRLTTMRPVDFRWGGAHAPAQLEADLRHLWSDSEIPALAALAAEVARLALALRRDDDQAADVADFIYVMY